MSPPTDLAHEIVPPPPSPPYLLLLPFLSPSSSWPTQAAVRPPASSSTGARLSSRRLRSRPRALPSSRPVSSSQIVRPTPKRSLLLPPNILTLCWVLSTAAEDYLDLSKSAEHDNYVQKTLDRQKVRSSPPLPSQLYTLRAVGADLLPPAISFLQVLPPVTLSNLLQNIQWVSFLALTGEWQQRSFLPFISSTLANRPPALLLIPISQSLPPLRSTACSPPPSDGAPLHGPLGTTS